MIMILGAIAAVVLIVLLVFSTGLDQKHRKNALDYRARRRSLIDRMEALAGRLESMADLLSARSELSQHFGTLEKLLGSFEVLVSAYARVPAFGTNPDDLDSAEFLVRDCEQRASELEFQCGMRSRAMVTRVAKLWRAGMAKASGAVKKNPAVARGCYFCSRPFHQNLERFSSVRVRIEGITRDAFSCGPCKDNLEETKKIKVLYFVSDGKPVHWSEVPGYVPSEAYWRLNQEDSGTSATRHLKLVTAETDRES
jgi:hypothetical protein